MELILRLLWIAAFLGVHYVYTPLHLSSEAHGESETHAAHAHGHVHAHHSHGHDHDHDGEPADEPSPHDPHPASDHELAAAVACTSQAPHLELALLEGGVPAVFVDAAPRACPIRSPLPEPRPPPGLAPQQPRAPPTV